jgi:uncharacterized protein YneF (UPF0154 family)
MEVVAYIVVMLIGIMIGYIIGIFRERKYTQASETNNRTIIQELQDENIQLHEKLNSEKS